jgi:endonuclease YncB( thermonuclease family)
LAKTFYFLSYIIKIHCLVAIAFLITACNDEPRIKDSNFWQLKTGSIESGDRFEVINKTSKRELKIKLCGVVPPTQGKLALESSNRLKAILDKGSDRLILVGNGKDGDRRVAEVFINQGTDETNSMVGDLRVPPEKDREEIVVNALMILSGMARA